jgi:hypothetical protein
LSHGDESHAEFVKSGAEGIRDARVAVEEIAEAAECLLVARQRKATVFKASLDAIHLNALG